MSGIRGKDKINRKAVCNMKGWRRTIGHLRCCAALYVKPWQVAWPIIDEYRVSQSLAMAFSGLGPATVHPDSRSSIYKVHNGQNTRCGVSSRNQAGPGPIDPILS